jgi:hypothetical protein
MRGGDAPSLFETLGFGNFFKKVCFYKDYKFEVAIW